MDILGITKNVVGFVASMGVGAVVGNAIKITTPPDLTRLSKFLVKAGTVTFVGISGVAASKYVENTIDEVVDNYKVAKAKADENMHAEYLRLVEESNNLPD